MDEISSAVEAADPNSPVVVTGPSGWIGSAFLAMFADRWGKGWADRVRLFGAAARLHSAPDGTNVPVRALDELRPADTEGALVIHLAYLTKEKAEQLGERRFMDTNLAIDETLLRALGSGRPRGVFVASSGAAALAADGRDRHPYGMCKLMQEDRFQRFAVAADVPVLIGRIFNLSGPYINKFESYAISSFLTQAFETGAIRIEARRPVYRSYLHVSDLCSLVMLLLERRIAPPLSIDFCGTEIVEMIDIATEVARVAALHNSAILRDVVDYAAPSIYLGDPTGVRSAAMACGMNLAGFGAQVEDTAHYVRAILQAGALGKSANINLPHERLAATRNSLPKG